MRQKQKCRQDKSLELRFERFRCAYGQSIAQQWFHYFPKEKIEAAKWIKDADQGNGCSKAMNELGKYFYDEGQDPEKAFYWLQNACGKGDVKAQATIGVMYMHGNGTEKSIEKALACLKASAMSGNCYARGHLAELQYKLKLYTEAAHTCKSVYDHYLNTTENFNCEHEREGLAIAAFILGVCLTRGRGVVLDDYAGEQLIKFAVEANHQVALRLHREWVKGAI